MFYIPDNYKGENVKKLVIGICGLAMLAGCDDVDISKYPENIQSCYNNIIYNADNCTTSKKAIVKHCECYESQYAPKATQVKKKYQMGSMATNHNRFVNFVYANEMNKELKELSDQVAADCAKKTGYTLIRQCKSNNKDKE